MKKLSQTQKVVEFLKQNPQQKFTARQIAEAITAQYPDDYQNKKAKFADEKAFVQQIVAEIGSQKESLIKACPDIQMQDKPRPRLYWYEHSSDTDVSGSLKHQTFSEHDLYPQLMQFLSEELKLYCLRIDEKRSKNNRGSKGNQWLHPDIVAMQALDKQWTDDIRQCVKLGSGQNVALWSFEVKRELNGANVRESFFSSGQQFQLGKRRLFGYHRDYWRTHRRGIAYFVGIARHWRDDFEFERFKRKRHFIARQTQNRNRLAICQPNCGTKY